MFALIISWETEQNPNLVDLGRGWGSEFSSEKRVISSWPLMAQVQNQIDLSILSKENSLNSEQGLKLEKQKELLNALAQARLLITSSFQAQISKTRHNGNRLKLCKHGKHYTRAPTSFTLFRISCSGFIDTYLGGGQTCNNELSLRRFFRDSVGI